MDVRATSHVQPVKDKTSILYYILYRRRETTCRRLSENMYIGQDYNGEYNNIIILNGVVYIVLSFDV